MNQLYKALPFLLLPFLVSVAHAQQDTTKHPAKEPETKYVSETFSTTRVILGQSVQTNENGGLEFIVSHHFGAINTKFYNFFGLDQASTRLGIEYGFNDWLCAGIGRSTYNKTWDGFIKARIITQCKGAKNMPLSLSIFSNIAVNTLKNVYPSSGTQYYEQELNTRLSYCTEIIIARKFGKIFSFQLEPIWVHKNLVPEKADHNDQYAIGGGGSARLSKKIAVNMEYFFFFDNQTAHDVINSVSIGCDITAGGHVFQLFLTNSQGNFEEAFITESNGKWKDGYIYFGFNIHRVFNVKSPKNSKFD